MIYANLTRTFKHLLTAIIVVNSCFFFGIALAMEDSAWRKANNDWSQSDRHLNGPLYQTDIRSIPSSNRWAQNKKSSLRSKGEVINEVKRRYNATVLKIRLNEKRSVYNVRILLPSGKVKSIQVSAMR